jgi:hypothetical protein
LQVADGGGASGSRSLASFTNMLMTANKNAACTM